MPHVAVTLEYAGRTIDLALPLQVPARLLVEALVGSLGLPTDRGQAYFLGMKSVAGPVRFPPHASLGEMDVLHGTRLVLLEEGRRERQVIQTGAGLRAENGAFFSLRSKVILIGRNDPRSGIFVEIDLSPLAADPRIISRRHAQIEQEGGRFYITDLGSKNGTRLNGTLLSPRQKIPLWPGDWLEFGKDGVRLVLESPLSRNQAGQEGSSSSHRWEGDRG